MLLTNREVIVRDLGSRNGTYVDGVAVVNAAVTPQSLVAIGHQTLRFVADRLEVRREAMPIAASGIAVDVKGTRILEPTSLSIEPGSFVAIIGGSGAGKTTLLKTLAGVIRPSEGSVTINGEPTELRQSVIGYVPQDEIVHPLLTVREALTYAARLRLPDDTSTSELESVTNGVMQELELRDRADTRIANLSGGQRKRAGVGTELVNEPKLLFLDEATTGLDPALERRMMEMMRDLACDGRTVITVTHATRNLDLCDAIVVMGKGGRLCFLGAPQDARHFFGVRATDEIYTALENLSPIEWQRRWKQWDSNPDAETGSAEPRRAEARPRRASAQRQRQARQAAVLANRYTKITLRDRRNLILLVGQVPILAAAIGALYPGKLWSTIGQGDNVSALIFLIVTLAIWIGAIDASREIIKERTIVEREAAVGVRRGPYLLSKLGVLGILGTIQTIVLVLVIALMLPGAPDAGGLLLVVLVTTWTAVAMGLLISSFVGTENQAVSFIPLALIPQLLFAGQIVPYATMTSVLKGVSVVIFSRWAFAGVGHLVDLPARLPAHELHASFGTSFFSLPLAGTFAVLVGFALAFLGFTLRQLPRQARD